MKRIVAASALALAFVLGAAGTSQAISLQPYQGCTVHYRPGCPVYGNVTHVHPWHKVAK